MPIDQSVLGRMRSFASKDLDGLTKQLAGMDESIAKWTEDDTLYKGMKDNTKSSLESRLAVKLTTLPTTTDAWQASHTYVAGSVVRPTVANGYLYYSASGGVSGGVQPVWPTTPGDTVLDGTVTWVCESLGIVYGPTYNVTNISDWEIQLQPAGVSIYQYQASVVDAKTYSVNSGSFSGQKTVRNIVSGFSQSLDWVRIGIQGHSTYMTTVVNVSIGERDGATQNIVPGTFALFAFLGSDRKDINPGIIEYTDWLEYALDSAKTYFITMFVESMYHTYSGAGQQFYRSGNYSLEENWGTSGSGPTGSTSSLKIVQGWLNGPGQGWDGDVIITNAINDWLIMYPLIYSSPYGTQPMLSSLSSGRSVVSGRKTQIQNRNPILGHFETFTIQAVVIGGNGSISPSGTVTVGYLGSQTFTMTPDPGYVVDKVVVDAEEQGAIGSYTFNNVQGNHSIAVYFKTP